MEEMEEMEDVEEKWVEYWGKMVRVLIVFVLDG